MVNQFKNLQQLMDYFKEDSVCKAYYEQYRWGGTIACIHCGSTHVYRTNRGFKCGENLCGKKFSVLVGTIFENTKISLRTWFAAMFMIATAKKGISSLQLGRDLGIHQSSAWFLLHRIRETFRELNVIQLGGEGCIVETDTTIVGGKVKNMHKSKRKSQGKKGSELVGRMDNKTAVAGYVERGGNIRFDVVNLGEHEKDMVTMHVDTDSFLMTDEAHCYVNVGKDYAGHEAVRHSMNEYVRGNAHTNTIEGAFSHFDRMVIGTYHNITRKHMQAYANECAYRYNTRKMQQPIRFEDVITKCSGIRLKYDALTA